MRQGIATKKDNLRESIVAKKMKRYCVFSAIKPAKERAAAEHFENGGFYQGSRIRAVTPGTQDGMQQ